MSRIYFEAKIRALLKFFKKTKHEIALTFVDDKEMARLNSLFLGKKGPTDVLSFPLDQKQNLGDIVVSLDTAKIQAGLVGVTLRELVVVLLVHGFLHLLGFDHHNKNKKNRMRKMESKLLIKLIGSDLSLIALENKIH
ncbi:MAG: hypothetical protein ACD_73C00015G0002 [uncultured bacterium]|nr:MAG: hypothetical protein ACD_73C00015G0002 [uncultured bacterium]